MFKKILNFFTGKDEGQKSEKCSVDSELLEKMIKENKFLQDVSLGSKMIIASIIKANGGELRIPSYIVQTVTPEIIVEHETIDDEEVFRIREENLPVGESIIN